MKRNIWLSTAILVVLGIVTYAVLQGPGESSKTGPSEDVLVHLDSAAVDKLEISSSNGVVLLQKEGEVWYLVSLTNKSRAADLMVTSAVGAGAAVKLKTLVSTNPEKQTLFKVDSTGTVVKFFEKGTEKAIVHIGKPTTSFSETYVRLEGSNDVYIAEGMLTSFFDRKPKQWRDKGIYKTPKESITEVMFHYGDTTFVVSLKDSIWRMDDVVIGEPTSFIASLAKFETEDFVDTTIAKLPTLSASIEVNRIEMHFYFDKNTSRYFVQTTESPQWYSIPLWKAKQVLKRRTDFLAMKKTG